MGELPAIIIAGDLLQFSPPGQCFYLVGMPLYPICQAQGHRVPQHQLGPPYQGVPGDGAPGVRDTLSLPCHLPQVFTSWTHCSVPPHPARLAGATGRLHPSQHPFPGYPQTMRGHPLSKGYMLLLPGMARRLGPPSNSAPVARSHLHTLHC